MDRLNVRVQIVKGWLLLISARKLPLVTTGLLIVSYVASYSTHFATIFPLWIGELNTVLIFLHPFFHLSVGHLVFDTVLWLVAGTLLEKWTMLSRKNWGIVFIFCYLASLTATYMKWKYVGPRLVQGLGLSGMISATVPFLLFYCLFFCKEIRTRELTIVAPFGVGILFWFVIGPLFGGVTTTDTWSLIQLGDTSVLHLLAFAFSSVPAFLLMLLIVKPMRVGAASTTSVRQFLITGAILSVGASSAGGNFGYTITVMHGVFGGYLCSLSSLYPIPTPMTLVLRRISKRCLRFTSLTTDRSISMLTQPPPHHTGGEGSRYRGS